VDTAGLAAASVKVRVEHDRTADFLSLRSYRWLPTPPNTMNIAPDACDERFAIDALDVPIMTATP
jgi:hypothetical protein